MSEPTEPAQMKSINITSAVQEEMDAKDKYLFADSTHQYLIYWGDDADHNCINLVIGLAVIVIQWVLIAIIVSEAVDLFKKDRVPVEIVWSDCSDDILASELKCEAEVGGDQYAVLGFVLLAFYLMGDVIGAFRAFLTVPNISSKIGSIVIIISAGYAAYAGSLFAYQGVYQGSGYDAIVNCIGILFVIDIDEKVYTSVKHITFGDKLKTGCCSCLCCKCCDSAFKLICLAICAAIFIVIGFVAVETVLAAAEAADNQF